MIISHKNEIWTQKQGHEINDFLTGTVVVENSWPKRQPCTAAVVRKLLNFRFLIRLWHIDALPLRVIEPVHSLKQCKKHIKYPAENTLNIRQKLYSALLTSFWKKILVPTNQNQCAGLWHWNPVQLNFNKGKLIDWLIDFPERQIWQDFSELGFWLVGTTNFY